MRDEPERGPASPNDPAESILEENLRRLLERADRPVGPSELGRARLQRAMREAQDRAVAAREARTRGDGRRPWIATAAVALLAAVLLLAIELDRAPSGSTEVRVVARASSEGAFSLRPSGARDDRPGGTSAWRVVDRATDLRPGDTVRVIADPVRVLDDGCDTVLLEDGSLSFDPRGPMVSARSFTWEVGAECDALCFTPGITLRATDARVRVEVLPHEGQPLPAPWEGNLMNAKMIGAGVGVAALVTVLVLFNDGGPVELEHAGTMRELEEGDVATVDGSGTVRVARGGDAASVTATDPADRDAAAASLEALTETDLPVVQLLVQDPEGAPVEGATVEILQGLEDFADAIRLTGKTDEKGIARVTLPEMWGGWVASATADRFGRARVPWSVTGVNGWTGVQPGDGGADGNGASADAASEDPAVLDPTEEPLVITLPYETSITGIVVDGTTGEPVVGALTAIQFDAGATGWSEPRLAKFDEEDGSYYFSDIRPGTYWVWSYHEGFARSGKLTVPVVDGERTVCDPIVLGPGVDVVVTVFDEETGQPVSGAVVYPHVAHLPGTVDFPHRGRSIDERVRNVGRTDAEGHTVVQDLSSGTVLLRVLHDDYRIQDFDVEGRAGEQLEFEVALSTGPSIRGEVIDGEGNPVNTSEIYAVTMTMQRDKAEVLAGEITDGAYEIRNVNPGQYVVVFNGVAGDGSDMKMQFCQVNTKEDTIVDFVEVAQLGTLRGTIVDGEGAPFARKFVTVTTLDDRGEVTFRSGTTDGEGKFEIKNLALKEWMVAVSRSPESMVTIGTVNIERAIDYEETFEVPSGSVIGTIVNEDGDPAERVELFLFELVEREDGSVEQVWRGRSEALEPGRFVFDGLAAGRYQAFAQGPGYRQVFSAPFDLAEADTAKVSMKIEPGGTVAVTVLDHLGAPASDHGVRIRNAQGMPINDGLPARTDASGLYTFPMLGPGDYTAQAFDDSGVLGEPVPFTSEVGGVVTVEIRLPQ